jgi:hypothetical protein
MLLVCAGAVSTREDSFDQRFSHVATWYANTVDLPTLVKSRSRETWYEWIIQGQVCTMCGVAKPTGVNENYVSRISIWLCFQEI